MREDVLKNGESAARVRPGLGSVDELVARRPARELKQLYQFWSGDEECEPPLESAVARARIVEWMSEPARLASRVEGLGRRLNGVFSELMGREQYRSSFVELSQAEALESLTEYDLRTSLETLVRHGLAVPEEDERSDPGYAVPRDLGDTLLRQRRLDDRGIFDALTLRGHLDRMYSDPSRAARTSPQRLREMYKMYSTDTAAVARVERLPGGIKELVE
ncbi:MAG: hypothetical protein AAFZ65_16955, partial [Planctomycetota bacterium]